MLNNNLCHFTDIKKGESRLDYSWASYPGIGDDFDLKLKSSVVYKNPYNGDHVIICNSLGEKAGITFYDKDFNVKWNEPRLPLCEGVQFIDENLLMFDCGSRAKVIFYDCEKKKCVRKIAATKWNELNPIFRKDSNTLYFCDYRYTDIDKVQYVFSLVGINLDTNKKEVLFEGKDLICKASAISNDRFLFFCEHNFHQKPLIIIIEKNGQVTATEVNIISDALKPTSLFTHQWEEKEQCFLAIKTVFNPKKYNNHKLKNNDAAMQSRMFEILQEMRAIYRNGEIPAQKLKTEMATLQRINLFSQRHDLSFVKVYLDGSTVGLALQGGS